MPINSADSKHILVVGGAGFIGSHMVLMLQQAGYIPIVLDNLSHGHKEAVIGAELMVGELADKNLLQQLCMKYSFAAVMHFGGLIEVAESMQQPARYYQNNVAATLTLLEVMLAHSVNKIIFSSTAAVYGEPQYLPIDENHPLAPVNPYGRSKEMVETILKDYAVSDGLRYAILRYFNAAGADPDGRLGERHEPESHLIPLLLQVAAGKRANIHLFGQDYPTPDGTCIRDYVHVLDLCRAHLLALERLLDNQSSLLCNLGVGRGFSVQEVILAVRKVTNHAIPTIKATRRSGDPARLVANATLAKQLLHWQVSYPQLEIMVQHAWQFLNAQISNASIS